MVFLLNSSDSSYQYQGMDCYFPVYINNSIEMSGFDTKVALW